MQQLDPYVNCPALVCIQIVGTLSHFNKQRKDNFAGFNICSLVKDLLIVGSKFEAPRGNNIFHVSFIGEEMSFDSFGLFFYRAEESLTGLTLYFN